MTYNPKTLQDLGDYWRKQGGVNLGVVGNKAHTKGYHLGKDRIFDGSGPGVGWSDYSVQHARDKAGLSDAASAIDLGRLDGSLDNLRAFSRNLVKRCMDSAATRRDVREIIYSPDGKKVQRYDGGDNRIYTGPGNGDSSHLTHTHISWWRDSEKRDKRPVFAPYFKPAPPVPSEDPPMPTISTYIPGQVASVKPTSNIRKEPKVTGELIRTLAATEVWTVTGWCKGGVDPDGGSDLWLTRWGGTQWEYTAKANITAGPAGPPDGSPFSKADLDKASAGGFNDGLSAASAAVAAVPRK